MRTFTILVPVYLTSERRHQFEEWCLQKFGGFTDIGSTRGAWLGANRKRYDDTMVAYKILAPDGSLPELLALAFELFPSELAFYVETDGHGEIVDRMALDQNPISLLPGRHDRGWPK